MDELQSDGAPLRAMPDLLLSWQGQQAVRRVVDGAFVIGRECPSADISIEHPGVSRLHVRLVPDDTWRLVDYNSRNGVYLAGSRVHVETAVADGMTVLLGHPEGIAVTFNYVAPSTGPRGDRASESIDGGALEDLALDEDATEVITTEVRRALIVDQTSLMLARIASAIPQLPRPDDPRFPDRADALRRALTQVDACLATLVDLGAEDSASALDTVRAVYHRLLTPRLDSGRVA